MDSDPNIRMIRNNVGERIRALRKKKGLTQARLGQMVDLNRTYIVGVENGNRNISLDNLIKISLGLGTPLSKLYRHADTDVLEQLRHADKAPPPETRARAPAKGASPEGWESSGDLVPGDVGTSPDSGI